MKPVRTRRSRKAFGAFAALGLAIGLAVTARPAAAADNFTSAFVARWNLTNGKYLVDVGRYLEAIEAFDTALEMGTDADVRTEALLEKATAYAVFLDAPSDALKVYDDLIAQYPDSPAAESAVFRAGMTLFDGGQYEQAARYFDRYLQTYPHGASRGSAEFLLQQSRSKHAPEPTPVAPVAGPATTLVRVRVLKGHGRAHVESKGGLTVVPGGSSGHAVDLAAHNGRVAVNGGADASEVTVSSDQPLEVRVDGATRHYHGGLTVRADGNVLQLVNRVPIEEYLYGVVTKESAASWPPEALKAQAVASRTYAVYQVDHRQKREYDMVDDEGSQVYGGVEGESNSGRHAVDDTHRLVVQYRGRPIYAMFTANSGWHTADPAIIFDQPLPYLKAVPDPHSANQQLGHWTRKYRVAEIRSKLADIGVRLGTIRAIEPRLTCPSGRIVKADIVDENGPHLMRMRPTLGRALKLPEILLKVERNGDEFVFSGGGFGHGVGLSQWGAKSMADKGFKVTDILAFYYPGTELAAAP